MINQDAMTTETTPLTAATYPPTDKQRGALKTKRDEIDPAERLRKPSWIRVKAGSSSERFREIKDIVRANKLVTVCEEASCPNIAECWSKGTAPPDVLNHNIETVPRLYKEARPGADFQNTLNLLQRFKAMHPNIPTKSGLMVGLGETDEEILQVLRALRAYDVDMLTIGQYLQPSGGHMPVRRYVHPDTFKMYAEEARKMGFLHAASGPLVRSSYHADEQAHAAGVF